MKGEETSLKLLAAYENSTQHRLNFDFYGIGEHSVRTNISKERDRTIAKAF